MFVEQNKNHCSEAEKNKSRDCPWQLPKRIQKPKWQWKLGGYGSLLTRQLAGLAWKREGGTWTPEFLNDYCN